MRGCFLVFLMLIAVSCNINTDTSTSIPHTVNRSFYYWKQNFNMESADIKYMAELDLKTLYIRFFDIVWEPPTGAIPTAIIDFDSKIASNLSLIPCIYIENKVFQQVQANNKVEELAKKSVAKIRSLLKKSGKAAIAEIQLDCDWTKSTKLAYFHFLESFKKQWEEEVILSATIRLHQIKYAEKTGIPPVDKGMLMYYNMGKIKDIETFNSILDNQIGRQYISSQTDYELPLDMALPIFEWGVWFRRDKFAGIFNDLNLAKLRKMGSFKHLEKGVFMLEQDTVVGNRYLRSGDIIRLEEISAKALKEAVKVCRKAVNTKALNVSFYHWNKDLIEGQGLEFLEEVYDSFE